MLLQLRRPAYHNTNDMYCTNAIDRTTAYIRMKDTVRRYAVILINTAAWTAKSMFLLLFVHALLYIFLKFQLILIKNQSHNKMQYYNKE